MDEAEPEYGGPEQFRTGIGTTGAIARSRGKGLLSLDHEQIRKALVQLPAEFREAIVLREIEGCSYTEIAEVAGVPLGTVMSRLSRGRDWLRRLLSSPEKEPV